MRADYDWQNHLRKSFISLKKEMMQARVTLAKWGAL
jgi:hypothetical protein